MTRDTWQAAVLEKEMFMQNFINQTSKSCYYHLRQISSIQKYYRGHSETGHLTHSVMLWLLQFSKRDLVLFLPLSLAFSTFWTVLLTSSWKKTNINQTTHLVCFSLSTGFQFHWEFTTRLTLCSTSVSCTLFCLSTLTLQLCSTLYTLSYSPLCLWYPQPSDSSYQTFHWWFSCLFHLGPLCSEWPFPSSPTGTLSRLSNPTLKHFFPKQETHHVSPMVLFFLQHLGPSL